MSQPLLSPTTAARSQRKRLRVTLAPSQATLVRTPVKAPVAAVCQASDTCCFLLHASNSALLVIRDDGSAPLVVDTPDQPLALGSLPQGLLVACESSLSVLDLDTVTPVWTHAVAVADAHASWRTPSLVLSVHSRQFRLFDVRASGRAPCFEGQAPRATLDFGRLGLNSVVGASAQGEVAMLDVRKQGSPSLVFGAVGEPVKPEWQNGTFAQGYRRHVGALAGLCVVDRSVVTCGNDGLIKAWEHGACVATWDSGVVRAHSAVPSPRGGLLVGFKGSDWEGVAEIDLTLSEPIACFKRPALFPCESCVEWQPHASRVVAGNLHGGLTVW